MEWATKMVRASLPNVEGAVANITRRAGCRRDISEDQGTRTCTRVMILESQGLENPETIPPSGLAVGGRARTLTLRLRLHVSTQMPLSLLISW